MSNVNNPNNIAYWKTKGYKTRPENWQEIIKNSKNKSIQKNPNNIEFWKSRGYENRPKNWKNLANKFLDNGSITSRRSFYRELSNPFPLDDFNFMCKEDY